MNEKIILAQLADDEHKTRKKQDAEPREFETIFQGLPTRKEWPPQGVEEPKHHSTQVVGSG